MSQLLVQVCKIDKVRPHSNPVVERLEIVEIQGWQCVVPKGQYTKGMLVVYIPPDTVIPEETQELLGVKQYVHNGRVRSIKLKGEPSFGIVTKVYDPSWRIGDNVAAFFKATKYEPKVNDFARGGGKSSGKYQGCLKDNPYLWRYTEIDNLRHFANIIPDGTEVVATEKIHGTSAAMGLVFEDGKLVWAARSKNHRRTPPMKTTRIQGPLTIWQSILHYCSGKLWLPKQEVFDMDAVRQNWWWHPFSNENIQRMIYDLSAPRPDGTQPKQVVLYGETYGPSVQELAYGITALDFKAFDLVIDGKFINYDEFSQICQKYNVPTVPLVYRGPYSLEKIREISSGKTLINNAGHIREGVVVKPTTEMTDPRVGRMIFKYISDDYLLAKEPDAKNRVLITEKSDD